MARKRYSAEQIIGYLREAEVLLAKGITIGQVCRDRCYRANVLSLATRLWKFERGSSQTYEGSGKGKYSIEEVGGRAVFG